MNDARAREAQHIFWRIEALRALGAPQRAIASMLDRMARLHEDRAKDLLGRQDVDGWIDLFAGITAWGEAGSEPRARGLLRFGEQMAHALEDGEPLVEELGRLDRWLRDLRVVPTLEGFARSLPPFDREAA